MTDKNLSEEQVLSALDWEINRFELESKRNGWTAWILWVALGSICWTLLAILDKASLNWPAIIQIVLGMSLLGDSIYIVYHSMFLAPNSREDNVGLRCHLLANLGTRLPSFVITIRYGIMFFLAKYVLSVDPSWMMRLVIGYSAFFIVLFCTIFVWSFFSSPIPVNRRSSSKGVKVFKILVFLSNTIPGMYFTASGVLTASLPDWRVALLIVTACYLFLMISHHWMAKPLLNMLIAIRREVAFRRIDLIKAVQESEIAVFGLGLTDVFQRELDSILQKIHALNAIENNMRHLHSEINEMVAKGNEFVRQKQEFLESALHSIQLYEKEEDVLLSGLEKNLKGLDLKKAMLIPNNAPSAIEEFREMIRSKVEPAMEDLRNKCHANRESLAQIKKKIAGQDIQKPSLGHG